MEASVDEGECQSDQYHESHVEEELLQEVQMYLCYSCIQECAQGLGQVPQGRQYIPVWGIPIIAHLFNDSLGNYRDWIGLGKKN